MSRFSASVFHFVCLSALVLCAVACSSEVDQNRVTGEESLIRSTATSGYYIYGHEVNTFQPCGSEDVYWVVSDATVLKELEEAYLVLQKAPYERSFVILNGQVKEAASDGFAADYDGRFLVESVVEVPNMSHDECATK